jgi:hypothetical protein
MKKQMTNLKKIIISLALVAGIASLASAQSIRFNGFAAYVFDDKVDSYYDPSNNYNGTINGGLQWGGSFEFMAGPSKGIELKYLRRDAIAPMNYYYNNTNQKHKDFELALNYILLGGTNYFQTGGKVEPYAGASLGMCILTIKNAEAGNDDQATKFAWGIKLGTNIWVSDKVGIKLQADLLSVTQSAGGGLYFGTGGGGAGVGLYSTMYQWGLGGGLTFKIK